MDSLLILNQNTLVADLLQYLWSPQKDLLPIVQNWFLKALAASDSNAYESMEQSNTNEASNNVTITLSTDEKILRSSALLLGEGGLITPETVPVLIRCLRMGDDRSRHRAVLVFNGTERFESLRNVSQFGTETALEIACQALKYVLLSLNQVLIDIGTREPSLEYRRSCAGSGSEQFMTIPKLSKSLLPWLIATVQRQKRRIIFYRAFIYLLGQPSMSC